MYLIMGKTHDQRQKDYIQRRKENDPEFKKRKEAERKRKKGEPPSFHLLNMKLPRQRIEQGKGTKQI